MFTFDVFVKSTMTETNELEKIENVVVFKIFSYGLFLETLDSLTFLAHLAGFYF